MFRQSASSAEVDKYVSEVEQQGGIIQQRYNADFLRGFAARMPEEYAEKLEAAVQGGKHDSMYVVQLTQRDDRAQPGNQCQVATVYSSVCSTLTSGAASSLGKHTAGVATRIE